MDINKNEQLISLPMKLLDTSRSRRVCELAVVLTRLNHAKERLLISVKTAKSSQDDETTAISDSLMRDAIVTFLACFDKNKDICFDRSIFTDPAELDLFDQLKDFRDSTIAHMFGALHQAKYTIILNPDSGEFIKGGCQQFYIRSCSGFSQLLSPLLQRSLEFAQKEMNKEMEALNSEIISMSIAELQLLDDHSTIRLPGAGQWRQSRKGFKT